MRHERASANDELALTNVSPLVCKVDHPPDVCLAVHRQAETKPLVRGANPGGRAALAQAVDEYYKYTFLLMKIKITFIRIYITTASLARTTRPSE